MPVRDILLDKQGNRLLNSAGTDYALVDGAQAVAQGVQCALSLQLTEYWLDQSLGTPYLQQILVKNPNPIVVKSVLAAQIAAVADITNVGNATLVLDSRTRAAAVTYSAASSVGAVAATVQVTTGIAQ